MLAYLPDGPKYTLRQEKDKPEQVAVTGYIQGQYKSKKKHTFTITATNEKGSITEKVTIWPHKLVASTPPMGWLSWEFYLSDVSQEKMMKTIDAMAAAELNKHGWKYIIIDDAWQQALGTREQGHPIKSNEKFPDIKALSDYARKKGFVLGIYTTPWTRSYCGKEGSGHNETIDVKQFADWGIGYVKLDYRPWEVKQLSIWHDTLKQTGKDIVLSFSNNGIVDGGAEFLRDITDVWRTGSDIGANFGSIMTAAYTQYLDHDGWKYLRKGHWPDLDMLEVGLLREGIELPQNEQQFQVSLWSIIPAPLMLSCDVTKLTPFHLSLITNDEVIRVNQDPLGLAAKPVVKGDLHVLYKPLADGTIAVGFFNPDDDEKEISVSFKALGFKGSQTIRDLWAGKDLGTFSEYKEKIGSRCAKLFKVGKPK
jgi:alpha-galactosidase